ncbi:hypothetical protein [Candidatus Cyanaurora vandensis]|uniref:hypothetical protein n=1 Tax=Candidatus Cyanaurora vandensis TaxID=2714958 RepID=UPI00257A7F82|nr:hypothetical protein [Candidatus Cyanaurora vandensis]
MLRLIISLVFALALPVQAFELGQTETAIRKRYGAPTASRTLPWRSLVYERSFGRVVLLVGTDGRVEAVLQFDNGYGKDYPQVGRFLKEQEPSFSYTDAKKTRSIELFQQISPRGFEAWLFKKQRNQVWVFGDLLALPYRRDEAREFLVEYARRLLADPKLILLAPVSAT